MAQLTDDFNEILTGVLGPAGDPVRALLSLFDFRPEANQIQRQLSGGQTAGGLLTALGMGLSTMAPPSRYGRVFGLRGKGGVAAEGKRPMSVVLQRGVNDDSTNVQSLNKSLANIRGRNINQLGKEGWAFTHDLSDGGFIGRNPAGSRGADHVLTSPQGSPILYGSSVDDLMRRGFPNEDRPFIMGSRYGDRKTPQGPSSTTPAPPPKVDLTQADLKKLTTEWGTGLRYFIFHDKDDLAIKALGRVGRSDPLELARNLSPMSESFISRYVSQLAKTESDLRSGLISPQEFSKIVEDIVGGPIGPVGL